jgi:pyrroloquinoline quinone biosynthesis protein D
VKPLDRAAAPRLARGVRLHRDRVRERWVLLAPERVLVVNAVGQAILELCDGKAALGDIIDDLADRFAAPRADIERETKAFVRTLADRRMIDL